MPIGIDVARSPELQAILLALRAVPNNVQKNIRTRTQQLLLPAWKEELAARATTAAQRKVLVATATVRMSNQNVRLTSAAKGRKLSGGLQPKIQGRGLEFGGYDSKVRYTATSSKGKSYSVTRRTGVQLGPRAKKGKVVLPTAKEMVPRFAHLWIDTTMRTLHDAFEGKES